MNKPAPKEPSMDEILSSIRQIIADDDAAGVPRRPTIQAAPPPMQATPARPMADSLDRDLSDMLDDIEPLALSPNQIVDKGEDDIGGFSFDSILADTETEEPSAAAAPQLVEPDDITFDIAEPAEEEELPAFDPPPMAVREPEPRVQASVAQAAPLPDPSLSSDMADQLLGPATQAAVRSSITKLNGLGLGNAGATIESLMRDMLRPMLKEWLDENLPSVVERMVEREITRVSRGE
ncbi:PopZ family protein [Devosia sp. Root635]|uniref:PopZ family protein n=1 Tax=Devosia sp. Root635 TaxID=1736575 RepID=UPI0006FC00C4|nr:DUF2497 domain-containing protein [Devosia sp. Root635]KRA50756.1 hypothetical protein ASD80_15620 [Devosia sp. Root635]